MGARVGFVEKEDLFKTGFKLHVIGSWCLQRGLGRASSTTQFKTSFVQVGSAAAVCVMFLHSTVRSVHKYVFNSKMLFGASRLG